MPGSMPFCQAETFETPFSDRETFLEQGFKAFDFADTSVGECCAICLEDFLELIESPSENTKAVPGENSTSSELSGSELPCGHRFCSPCIMQYFETPIPLYGIPPTNCPYCRKDFFPIEDDYEDDASYFSDEEADFTDGEYPVSEDTTIMDAFESIYDEIDRFFNGSLISAPELTENALRAHNMIPHSFMSGAVWYMPPHWHRPNNILTAMTQALLSERGGTGTGPRDMPLPSRTDLGLPEEPLCSFGDLMSYIDEDYIRKLPDLALAYFIDHATRDMHALYRRMRLFDGPVPMMTDRESASWLQENHRMLQYRSSLAQHVRYMRGEIRAQEEHSRFANTGDWRERAAIQLHELIRNSEVGPGYSVLEGDPEIEREDNENEGQGQNNEVEEEGEDNEDEEEAEDNEDEEEAEENEDEEEGEENEDEEEDEDNEDEEGGVKIEDEDERQNGLMAGIGDWVSDYSERSRARYVPAGPNYDDWGGVPLRRFRPIRPRL